MNFEKITSEEIVPVEENVKDLKQGIPEQVRQPDNSFAKWAKKTVALAGVAGVGFFGSLHESDAKDVSGIEKNTEPKLEQKEARVKDIYKGYEFSDS